MLVDYSTAVSKQPYMMGIIKDILGLCNVYCEKWNVNIHVCSELTSVTSLYSPFYISTDIHEDVCLVEILVLIKLLLKSMCYALLIPKVGFALGDCKRKTMAVLNKNTFPICDTC